MSRHMPSFIARIGFAALLLTALPLQRANAGHDIKEAWGRYQTACALYKADVARIERGLDYHDYIKLKFDQCLRDFSKARPEGSVTTESASVFCSNEYSALKRLRLMLKANLAELREVKRLCEKTRERYTTALSEQVTEWVVTGAEPDPNKPAPTTRTTRKPPTYRHSAKQSQALRNRRKPPQRGHSTAQTQAAAIIGGIIIQGIIKKGSKKRRPHPSSRPGYVP